MFSACHRPSGTLFCEACTRHGTILVFDEVITGFRLAPGGAQQLFGVTPDLSTFGKAIANGFPVAAIVGRADLMDLFSTGGVVHGGTYNGHPLTMAATAATLKLLQPSLYAAIETTGGKLMTGMREIFARAGVKASVTGYPQIFHVALGLEEPAKDYRGLAKMNRPAYVALTTELVRRGVRALERGAWFLSSEHSDAVIEETLAAFEDAVRVLRADGRL